MTEIILTGVEGLVTIGAPDGCFCCRDGNYQPATYKETQHAQEVHIVGGGYDRTELLCDSHLKFYEDGHSPKFKVVRPE